MSKKGIVLAQFKILKAKQTPDCSRPIRSKTGNNESKESKTDRGIEISIFTILDFFLLYQRGVSTLFLSLLINKTLQVVQHQTSPELMAELQLPSEFTKDAILILDIGYSLKSWLTTYLIIYEVGGGRQVCKITSFFRREMGKTLAHIVIIIHYRKTQSLKFLRES